MREIASAEVYALIGELQQKLSGFYFDKFYELGKGRFLFKVSRQGEKADLLCILKRTLNLTGYVEGANPSSNFYIAVRKRIMGYRIEQISQVNEDRIIRIEAKKGDSVINIIIEMFGQGNLIIADAEMKVLLTYSPISFKDRSIRIGEAYVAPRGGSLKLSELNESGVENLIAKAKGKQIGVVSLLAKAINAGAMYIENAVASAGVEPKASAGSLDEKSIKEIAKAVAKIKDCADKPDALVYRKEGKVVDYSICSMVRYSALEAQKMGSLQEALDIYCHEAAEQEGAESARAKEKENDEAKAIEKSIEKQKELLKEAAREAASYRKEGEEIFKNSTMIGELIAALRSNKRITKEELQALFPNIKILELNLKEKTVTISLESQ